MVGLITVHQQGGRIVDDGSRILGDTCVVTSVARRDAFYVKRVAVLVIFAGDDAQGRRYRVSVFIPREMDGQVALGYGTCNMRSHAHVELVV